MLDGMKIYNMIKQEAQEARAEMDKHLKLENEALDKNDQKTANGEYIARMAYHSTWITLSCMLAHIDVMEMQEEKEEIR